MAFESKLVLEKPATASGNSASPVLALSLDAHHAGTRAHGAMPPAGRRPAHTGNSGRGAGTLSGTTAPQRSVEPSVSRSFPRPKLLRTAFTCVTVTGGARLSQLLRT